MSKNCISSYTLEGLTAPMKELGQPAFRALGWSVMAENSVTSF